MAFSGFGPQTVPFFKALAFHQTKDWFDANRAIYDDEIKGPLGDLVEELTARFAKARIGLKGDRKARSSASIATCASPKTRAPTRPTPAPC